MSGDQKPPDRIGSKAAVGRRSEEDYLIDESSRIRDVLCKSLGNRPDMWAWITQTPGIDVTAVMADEKVLAATLGLLNETDGVYLTHMTAVQPAYRNLGLGTLMRQVQTLRKTRHVVSLSADSVHFTDDGKTAVDAQITMLRACGYKLVDSPTDARDMINMLDQKWTSLHLARTMERNFVRPLLFERVNNESVCTRQINDSDADNDLPDPTELSAQDALWIGEELNPADIDPTVDSDADPDVVPIGMSAVDIERALSSLADSDPPPSAPPSPPATDVETLYGPRLTDDELQPIADRYTISLERLRLLHESRIRSPCHMAHRFDLNYKHIFYPCNDIRCCGPEHDDSDIDSVHED